jgi:hypothetical protein
MRTFDWQALVEKGAGFSVFARFERKAEKQIHMKQRDKGRLQVRTGIPVDNL